MEITEFKLGDDPTPLENKRFRGIIEEVLAANIFLIICLENFRKLPCSLLGIQLPTDKHVKSIGENEAIKLMLNRTVDL